MNQLRALKATKFKPCDGWKYVMFSDGRCQVNLKGTIGGSQTNHFAGRLDSTRMQKTPFKFQVSRCFEVEFNDFVI